VKNLEAQPCLIARSLSLVGDAHSGLTRFDQFRRSLGIAPTMLTKRLAALTQDGLLETRRYNDRPPRDEYVLTQSGRDYLPVLLAIQGWGQAHCNASDVTRFLDDETGIEIEPVMIDKHTGAPIGTRAIRIVQPE